jgi:hypothetical protein
MLKSRVRRGLVAALVAAGTLGATTGVATADTPSTYKLTKKERRAACGNFGGTIIFSDGSSLDCSTGIATLPVENEF